LIATISGPAFRSESNIADMVSKGYITAEEGKLIGMQAKTEDLWAESQLSNTYNVTSLLTNNLGGIAPNGQPYKYTFKADEEDDNTILLQQVDGAVVPNFDSAVGKVHKQTAKDGLLAATRGALDVTVAGQAISGTTPPQQQQWQAGRGDEKKKERTAVGTWGLLYNGTPEEVESATNTLLGTEKSKEQGVSEIDTKSKPGYVIITYDGSGTIKPSQRVIPMVREVNGEMVPVGYEEFAKSGNEITGVDDVTEAIKAAGSDANRPYNEGVGAVARREGTADYTAPFANYLDKFAPAGTDEGGYKTADSGKINLYYGPDIVIPQIKKAFPDLGLVVTKFSGDEIEVKIPGSKAPSLILEVDLYQTSNQGEAISALMNYIEQNTPKSLINKIGKKKGWEATTSSGSGSGSGSGGSAPR